MAARKKTELAPMSEPEPFDNEVPFESSDDDNDVIVLKKSLVVNIGIALLFFLIGAGASWALFVIPREAELAAQRVQLAAGGQAVQQPTQPPSRIDNVGLGKLPPYGPPNAPVKIVEFSDFQCPYCKQWTDNTLEPLREKYGDKIVFYFRHYPLTSIHPEAMNGAVAGECANAQGKFWEMHDSLFRTQSLISVDNSETLASSLGLDAQKFNECMDSNPYEDTISSDMNDAVTYGVTGTPTFFVNGVRLVGALPLAQFTAVIDQELSK